MSVRLSADRRRAVVTVLALACALAMAAAAPSRAAAATVVPQFSVTSKLSTQRHDGHRVLVVARVRIAGIHGSLRIGCAKCLRLAGQITRVQGRNRSVTMSGVNWILTSRRSVLVSVVRKGKIGRFVRLGTSAARPSRLTYRVTGCMTSKRRVTPCPAGTRTIIPGQMVGRLGSRSKPRTSTVPAATEAPAAEGPTTPAELAIAATSASSITVSWQASSSPAGIADYTVYLNGTPMARIPVLSYTLSGLPCSIGFTIGVRATDQAGNVSPLSEIGASTQGCPAPPPASSAWWNETLGNQTAGAHTWATADGRGQEGQLIGPGETIAVSCRLEGAAAQDGNTWWYRIASAPWSNLFYVPADAFYNDGVTSGDLAGTPFYDSAVAIC